MMPPTFSVLIPTIGRDSRLDKCLWSVRCHQSELPKEEVEIIVASGSGIQDEWLVGLCQKYGAKLLDNSLGQDAATGKYLALKEASGRYVVMLDSDNELAYWDTLELVKNTLYFQESCVLGVESYYLSSVRMSSLCKYLTTLLHISDPISWMIAKLPRMFTQTVPAYETWIYGNGGMSWPMGANGFIFVREGLIDLCKDGRFEDSEIVVRLSLKMNCRQWIRIPGRGVYHYVVDNLWQFIQKRRRQTFHYLELWDKGEDDYSWINHGSNVSPIVAALYCISILGPLYHTIRGIFKDKSLCWLWHMIVCPASVVGALWGIWTYLYADFIFHGTTNKERQLQGWLQPKR